MPRVVGVIFGRVDIAEIGLQTVTQNAVDFHLKASRILTTTQSLFDIFLHFKQKPDHLHYLADNKTLKFCHKR